MGRKRREERSQSVVPGFDPMRYMPGKKKLEEATFIAAQARLEEALRLRTEARDVTCMLEVMALQAQFRGDWSMHKLEKSIAESEFTAATEAAKQTSKHYERAAALFEYCNRMDKNRPSSAPVAARRTKINSKTNIDLRSRMKALQERRKYQDESEKAEIGRTRQLATNTLDELHNRGAKDIEACLARIAKIKPIDRNNSLAALADSLKDALQRRTAADSVPGTIRNTDMFTRTVSITADTASSAKTAKNISFGLQQRTTPEALFALIQNNDASAISKLFNIELKHNPDQATSLLCARDNNNFTALEYALQIVAPNALDALLKAYDPPATLLLSQNEQSPPAIAAIRLAASLAQECSGRQQPRLLSSLDQVISAALQAYQRSERAIKPEVCISCIEEILKLTDTFHGNFVRLARIGFLDTLTILVRRLSDDNTEYIIRTVTICLDVLGTLRGQRAGGSGKAAVVSAALVVSSQKLIVPLCRIILLLLKNIDTFSDQRDQLQSLVNNLDYLIGNEQATKLAQMHGVVDIIKQGYAAALSTPQKSSLIIVLSRFTSRLLFSGIPVSFFIKAGILAVLVQSVLDSRASGCELCEALCTLASYGAKDENLIQTLIQENAGLACCRILADYNSNAQTTKSAQVAESAQYLILTFLPFAGIGKNVLLEEFTHIVESNKDVALLVYRAGCISRLAKMLNNETTFQLMSQVVIRIFNAFIAHTDTDVRASEATVQQQNSVLRSLTDPISLNCVTNAMIRPELKKETKLAMIAMLSVLIDRGNSSAVARSALPALCHFAFLTNELDVQGAALSTLQNLIMSCSDRKLTCLAKEILNRASVDVILRVWLSSAQALRWNLIEPLSGIIEGILAADLHNVEIFTRAEAFTTIAKILSICNDPSRESTEASNLEASSKLIKIRAMTALLYAVLPLTKDKGAICLFNQHSLTMKLLESAEMADRTTDTKDLLIIIHKILLQLLISEPELPDKIETGTTPAVRDLAGVGPRIIDTATKSVIDCLRKALSLMVDPEADENSEANSFKEPQDSTIEGEHEIVLNWSWSEAALALAETTVAGVVAALRTHHLDLRPHSAEAALKFLLHVADTYKSSAAILARNGVVDVVIAALVQHSSVLEVQWVGADLVQKLALRCVQSQQAAQNSIAGNDVVGFDLVDDFVKNGLLEAFANIIDVHGQAALVKGNTDKQQIKLIEGGRSDCLTSVVKAMHALAQTNEHNARLIVDTVLPSTLQCVRSGAASTSIIHAVLQFLEQVQCIHAVRAEVLTDHFAICESVLGIINGTSVVPLTQLSHRRDRDSANSNEAVDIYTLVSFCRCVLIPLATSPRACWVLHRHAVIPTVLKALTSLRDFQSSSISPTLRQALFTIAEFLRKIGLTITGSLSRTNFLVPTSYATRAQEITERLKKHRPKSSRPYTASTYAHVKVAKVRRPQSASLHATKVHPEAATVSPESARDTIVNESIVALLKVIQCSREYKCRLIATSLSDIMETLKAADNPTPSCTLSGVEVMLEAVSTLENATASETDKKVPSRPHHRRTADLEEVRRTVHKAIPQMIDLVASSMSYHTHHPNVQHVGARTLQHLAKIEPERIDSRLKATIMKSLHDIHLNLADANDTSEFDDLPRYERALFASTHALRDFAVDASSVATLSSLGILESVVDTLRKFPKARRHSESGLKLLCASLKLCPTMLSDTNTVQQEERSVVLVRWVYAAIGIARVSRKTSDTSYLQRLCCELLRRLIDSCPQLCVCLSLNGILTLFLKGHLNQINCEEDVTIAILDLAISVLQSAVLIPIAAEDVKAMRPIISGKVELECSRPYFATHSPQGTTTATRIDRLIDEDHLLQTIKLQQKQALLEAVECILVLNNSEFIADSSLISTDSISEQKTQCARSATQAAAGVLCYMASTSETDAIGDVSMAVLRLLLELGRGGPLIDGFAYWLLETPQCAGVNALKTLFLRARGNVVVMSDVAALLRLFFKSGGSKATQAFLANDHCLDTASGTSKTLLDNSSCLLICGLKAHILDALPAFHIIKVLADLAHEGGSMAAIALVEAGVIAAIRETLELANVRHPDTPPLAAATLNLLTCIDMGTSNHDELMKEGAAAAVEAIQLGELSRRPDDIKATIYWASSLVSRRLAEASKCDHECLCKCLEVAYRMNVFERVLNLFEKKCIQTPSSPNSITKDPKRQMTESAATSGTFGHVRSEEVIDDANAIWEALRSTISIELDAASLTDKNCLSLDEALACAARSMDRMICLVEPPTKWCPDHLHSVLIHAAPEDVASYFVRIAALKVIARALASKAFLPKFAFEVLKIAFALRHALDTGPIAKRRRFTTSTGHLTLNHVQRGAFEAISEIVRAVLSVIVECKKDHLVLCAAAFFLGEAIFLPKSSTRFTHNIVQLFGTEATELLSALLRSHGKITPKLYLLATRALAKYVAYQSTLESEGSNGEGGDAFVLDVLRRHDGLAATMDTWISVNETLFSTAMSSELLETTLRANSAARHLLGASLYLCCRLSKLSTEDKSDYDSCESSDLSEADEGPPGFVQWSGSWLKEAGAVSSIALALSNAEKHLGIVWQQYQSTTTTALPQSCSTSNAIDLEAVHLTEYNRADIPVDLMCLIVGMYKVGQKEAISELLDAGIGTSLVAMIRSVISRAKASSCSLLSIDELEKRAEPVAVVQSGETRLKQAAIAVAVQMSLRRASLISKMQSAGRQTEIIDKDEATRRRAARSARRTVQGKGLQDWRRQLLVATDLGDTKSIAGFATKVAVVACEGALEVIYADDLALCLLALGCATVTLIAADVDVVFLLISNGAVEALGDAAKSCNNAHGSLILRTAIEFMTKSLTLVASAKHLLDDIIDEAVSRILLVLASLIDDIVRRNDIATFRKIFMSSDTISSQALRVVCGEVARAPKSRRRTISGLFFLSSNFLDALHAVRSSCKDSSISEDVFANWFNELGMANVSSRFLLSIDAKTSVSPEHCKLIHIALGLQYSLDCSSEDSPTDEHISNDTISSIEAVLHVLHLQFPENEADNLLATAIEGLLSIVTEPSACNPRSNACQALLVRNGINSIARTTVKYLNSQRLLKATVNVMVPLLTISQDSTQIDKALLGKIFVKAISFFSKIAATGESFKDLVQAILAFSILVVGVNREAVVSPSAMTPVLREQIQDIDILFLSSLPDIIAILVAAARTILRSKDQISLSRIFILLHGMCVSAEAGHEMCALFVPSLCLETCQTPNFGVRMVISPTISLLLRLLVVLRDEDIECGCAEISTQELEKVISVFANIATEGLPSDRVGEIRPEEASVTIAVSMSMLVAGQYGIDLKRKVSAYDQATSKSVLYELGNLFARHSDSTVGAICSVSIRYVTHIPIARTADAALPILCRIIKVGSIVDVKPSLDIITSLVAKKTLRTTGVIEANLPTIVVNRCESLALEDISTQSNERKWDLLQAFLNLLHQLMLHHTEACEKLILKTTIELYERTIEGEGVEATIGDFNEVDEPNASGSSSFALQFTAALRAHEFINDCRPLVSATPAFGRLMTRVVRCMLKAQDSEVQGGIKITDSAYEQILASAVLLECKIIREHRTFAPKAIEIIALSACYFAEGTNPLVLDACLTTLSEALNESQSSDMCKIIVRADASNMLRNTVLSGTSSSSREIAARIIVSITSALQKHATMLIPWLKKLDPKENTNNEFATLLLKEGFIETLPVPSSTYLQQIWAEGHLWKIIVPCTQASAAFAASMRTHGHGLKAVAIILEKGRGNSDHLSCVLSMLSVASARDMNTDIKMDDMFSLGRALLKADRTHLDSKFVNQIVEFIARWILDIAKKIPRDAVFGLSALGVETSNFGDFIDSMLVERTEGALDVAINLMDASAIVDDWREPELIGKRSRRLGSAYTRIVDALTTTERFVKTVANLKDSEQIAADIHARLEAHLVTEEEVNDEDEYEDDYDEVDEQEFATVTEQQEKAIGAKSEKKDETDVLEKEPVSSTANQHEDNKIGFSLKKEDEDGDDHDEYEDDEDFD